MIKINTKKFDAQNQPEGVWITYSDGVRFKIRKLTNDALREIRKPFVRIEMELDQKTRSMKQVEKVNEDKLNDAITTYLIEAFEGIGDENGAPLPDNLASRQAIINQPVLSDFIWAAAQSLEIAQQQKEQEEIKK